MVRNVPLSVSVTVAPSAASLVMIVPLIIWLGVLVCPPAVVISTVGATVSTTKPKGGLSALTLPAASPAVAV